MRDSALKRGQGDDLERPVLFVGEELMRDSALKQEVVCAAICVCAASEKSSCATAL